MLPRKFLVFAGLTKQVALDGRRCFYDIRTKNDTIFAPITDIQRAKGSPLGVIRISGTKTSQILSKLTNREPIHNNNIEHVDHKRPFRGLRPREATLARIFTPNTNDLIDIGLVLWFPNPNSYTGEDCCELHLHGSRAILTNVLEVLGSWPGVRPAEPGEFTQRAVLNRKMSLVQAESLLDLINSRTDSQRRLALSGLDGSTKAKYELWTNQLIDILAHLEASIDFGEDELLGEQAVINDCIGKLKQLQTIVGQLISDSSRSRELIQSGIKVTILGKPNAGKSTFMNLLCCSEKSIVSDLSGTTRDVVEHSFELAGHSLLLCDTAGLKDISTTEVDGKGEGRRESELERHDSIEREGIRRALDTARRADVIIYMVDGGRLEPNEDNLVRIVKELDATLHSLDIEQRSYLVYVVINKLDKNSQLASSDIGNKLSQMFHLEGDCGDNILVTCISCLTRENVDNLIVELSRGLDKLAMGCPSSQANSDAGGLASVEFHYVNERHLSLLKSVHRHLKQASLMDLSSVDEMAQHVRESVDYLSRIVGAISNDQVIDVIFKDFCIGK